MLSSDTRATDFPSLENKVYLNTAAEGIPPVSSAAAFQSYQNDKGLGMDGRERLFATFDACRESTADLFGLSAEEVSFCSSTSEAYNLLATAIDFPRGSEVVITDLDFPSGVTPWLRHPHEPKVRV